MRETGETDIGEAIVVAIFGIAVAEFLSGWLGVVAAALAIIFIIYKMIYLNKAEKRAEEAERRAQEAEKRDKAEHELRMKLLRKELDEKDQKGED